MKRGRENGVIIHKLNFFPKKVCENVFDFLAGENLYFIFVFAFTFMLCLVECARLLI